MILLSENKEIQNERFILNAQNISYKDAFSLIVKSVVKNPPRYQIKPWMVNVFYPMIKLFGTIFGRGTTISRENLKSAFGKTVYSSDKIEKRIDFQFRPVSESIAFIGDIYRKDL